MIFFALASNYSRASAFSDRIMTEYDLLPKGRGEYNAPGGHQSAAHSSSAPSPSPYQLLDDDDDVDSDQHNLVTAWNVEGGIDTVSHS